VRKINRKTSFCCYFYCFFIVFYFFAHFLAFFFFFFPRKNGAESYKKSAISREISADFRVFGAFCALLPEKMPSHPSFLANFARQNREKLPFFTNYVENGASPLAKTLQKSEKMAQRLNLAFSDLAESNLWPKMDQNGPKMDQNGLKTDQNAPKFPENGDFLAQSATNFVLSRAFSAEKGGISGDFPALFPFFDLCEHENRPFSAVKPLKTAEKAGFGLFLARKTAENDQNGPKMAQKWTEMDQNGSKMDHNGSEWHEMTINYGSDSFFDIFERFGFLAVRFFILILILIFFLIFDFSLIFF
jgi:hypothetical protein